ncbi:peptidase inhibitor family I36 protein [Streptomyces cellulosae]|uniref:peptidase inhibitor family I36 protein n=1 Tax=Streptomyces cellulosae TaxID=1968 RepID=UPI00068C784A|nr:peptidase inhibitor family I36 protein [Streptomyces cellulosae]
MRIRNKVVAGALTAAGLGIGLIAAPAAEAAACNPSAGIGACLYYNSNFSGAQFQDGSGNSQSPENYGAPNWYTFSGGNGAGLYVKNNAASVYNYDTNYSVTIYYNSNNSGPSQYFKRGTGANLNSTLKNNNASQCFDFYAVCP